MAEPAPLDESSGLCVACGLCCNGGLFTDGRLVEGEREAVLAAGLEVIERAGAERLQLPCRHLSADTGCTIYEGRFNVCRTFRCALLRKVQAGEVPAAEAHRLVGEARAMLAAIEGGGSVRARHEARQALSRLAAIADPAERAEAARTYLKLAAAESFLDRHFRNTPMLWKGEGISDEAEAPGEAAERLPVAPDEADA